MKRLFVSAALLGATVAPAFAGGPGGGIDGGVGKVIAHFLGKLLGLN